MKTVFVAYFEPGKQAIRQKSVLLLAEPDLGETGPTTPNDIEGLQWVVSDADFDASNVHIENGRLVPDPPNDPPDPALAAMVARDRRDGLLTACDWVDTPRAVKRLGAALDKEWQDYRQRLRDWPASAGFPDLNTLPTPPGTQGGGGTGPRQNQ